LPYLTIKTYNDLNKYVRAFRRKHIGLLIIVSRAGLGKTYLVEEELEIEAPLVLNSHITPLAFYKTLYEKVKDEKDCLIMIDEAEMMFSNPKLKTMLKLLCDTRKEKVVQYTSTTPLIKGLPKEIETEAKVIMLINTLNPSDEHIKAIMSRGHLISFDPNDSEIFNYLNTWAEDKEITKFLGQYSKISKALTLRTYVKAEESKRSGLDWKAEVVNELNLDPKLLIVRRIINNYKKEADRIERWKKETGGSRSLYYRYRKLHMNKVMGKKLEDDEGDEELLKNFT